jgi:hypothetical protein
MKTRNTFKNHLKPLDSSNEVHVNEELNVGQYGDDFIKNFRNILHFNTFKYMRPTTSKSRGA